MNFLHKAVGVLLLVLSSGCSILPGLHVSGPGSEAVDLETSAERGGVTEYVGQADGQLVGYRVVEVNGQTLAQIRSSTELIFPPMPEFLQALERKRASPEYRIGPGDVVVITIWDHPELSAPLGDRSDIQSAGRLVSSDGMMFYPYVGEFRAAGMTVVELRSFLAQKLARVITNPQVDARVVAFRSQRVQVTGDVAQPGLVTLDDTSKGVLEAIDERGGLAEGASRRRALLTRDGVAYPLDLAAMLSGDRHALNPRLEAGDIVHVPDQSNDLVFVLGEVEKQSEVVLRQGRTTLTEALTKAGGLDKLRADDAGVLVFRRPIAQGVLPTIYSLEMDTPLGLLLAGEFALQPRDVVYVKATGFAQYNSVINQLLPTISAVFQLDALLRRN